MLQVLCVTGFGHLYVRMLVLLYIRLRNVRDTNIYMGRLFIIVNLYNEQLPPIDQQHHNIFIYSTFFWMNSIRTLCPSKLNDTYFSWSVTLSTVYFLAPLV